MRAPCGLLCVAISSEGEGKAWGLVEKAGDHIAPRHRARVARIRALTEELWALLREAPRAS